MRESELLQGKSQAVRLLDVFVLGPGMIYASKFKGPPDWIRFALLVTGIATIIYNGRNYLRIKGE